MGTKPVRQTQRHNPTSRSLTAEEGEATPFDGFADIHGRQAQPIRPDGPDFDEEPVPVRIGVCRDLGEMLWGNEADSVFGRR